MKKLWWILAFVISMLYFSTVQATQRCEVDYCVYLPLLGSQAATPISTPLITATAEVTPTATVWIQTATAASSATATVTSLVTTTVQAGTVTATPTATATATPIAIATATTTATATATPSATPSSNTTLIWTTGAQSPEARSEALGAMISGKLYVFSGYTDSTSIPKSRTANVYDTSTNTWSNLPDLPRPITHAGVATDGENIYLAGGVVGGVNPGEAEKINAINEVWRYNIANRTWSAMPALPQPRGAGELALLGRDLHFFGGTGTDRYTSASDHWVLSLDDSTSWIASAPLPNPRNHLGDAVIDGKIYAIGGQDSHNEALTTQTSLHVWDPATPEVWTELASLPAGRSHIGGSTIVRGGQIYVFGGEVDHTNSVDTVMIYNPQTNLWRFTTKMPSQRHSGVAGFFGNKVVYTTGSLRNTTYIGTFVP